jgi:hypothetical protein
VRGGVYRDQNFLVPNDPGKIRTAAADASIISDQEGPGRRRESIKIAVWRPGDGVVAQVEGELDRGNVQSLRIRH